MEADNETMTETEIATDGGRDEISEDDLEGVVPDVIAPKVAATLNLSLRDDDLAVTLAEAAAMSGLKYDGLVEIAEELGLDVDTMNETGQGIASSPDDFERREPDSTQERFCSECDGMTWMEVWNGKRGGQPTTEVRCKCCGGEGGSLSLPFDEPVYTGVLVSSDERDERLLELREQGIHPRVSER